MKSTFVSLLGIAMLSATMATAAQSADASEPDVAAASAPATVPFKAMLTGELAAAVRDRGPDGKVRFVFSIFDQATGGTKLFEETQDVSVSGKILYADIGLGTHGGIPATILQHHSNFYIEIAKASAAFAPLGSRQLVAFKPSSGGNLRPNEWIFVPVDPSICYTCGGEWPYLVGAWSTPLPGAYERPAGCNGGFVFDNDTRPYLCSR